MANTMAVARGRDSNRVKETHRLGSKSATADARTWRTFATAHVWADGSGYVEVTRDGTVIHRYSFGPETVTIEKEERHE